MNSALYCQLQLAHTRILNEVNVALSELRFCPESMDEDALRQRMANAIGHLTPIREIIGGAEVAMRAAT